jgi:hypothetical protein
MVPQQQHATVIPHVADLVRIAEMVYFKLSIVSNVMMAIQQTEIFVPISVYKKRHLFRQPLLRNLLLRYPHPPEAAEVEAVLWTAPSLFVPSHG